MILFIFNHERGHNAEMSLLKKTSDWAATGSEPSAGRWLFGGSLCSLVLWSARFITSTGTVPGTCISLGHHHSLFGNSKCSPGSPEPRTGQCRVPWKTWFCFGKKETMHMNSIGIYTLLLPNCLASDFVFFWGRSMQKQQEGWRGQQSSDCHPARSVAAFSFSDPPLAFTAFIHPLRDPVLTSPWP